MEPDGKRLLHGEIIIDGHKCFLSDEFGQEEGGTVKTPQTLGGGTCVRITLMVDDANATVERAVAAGARVLMPQDMFWGGRYGKIVDPFGHEWGINQQVKEQSPEETQAAADEFFAKRK